MSTQTTAVRTDATSEGQVVVVLGKGGCDVGVDEFVDATGGPRPDTVHLRVADVLGVLHGMTRLLSGTVPTVVIEQVGRDGDRVFGGATVLLREFGYETESARDRRGRCRLVARHPRRIGLLRQRYLPV